MDTDDAAAADNADDKDDDDVERAREGRREGERREGERIKHRNCIHTFELEGVTSRLV